MEYNRFMAKSPYKEQYTGFITEAVNGARMITRQELVTYEWRNDTLFKITTIRQFSMGGSDYIDTQTIVPVYQE